MKVSDKITLPELLARLEDVVEPAPVSYLPQTAAWWVLAAVIGVVLVVCGVRVFRRWQANAYRRDALVALDDIERRLETGDAAAAMALPALVRRVALCVAPREDVASLAGEGWLVFLDTRGGAARFSEGPGRRLLDLAYRPAGGDTLESGECRALVALTRDWIRSHHA